MPSKPVRPQRRKTNPKRRLRDAIDDRHAANLARAVTYRGSPLHKRSPGDFGLAPPSAPRPNKALCDGVEIFRVAEAMELLREGARKGVVSPAQPDEYPRYIWAVTESERVLEARCDDPERGLYHGYPLEQHDPMADLVRRRWREQGE